MPQMMPIFWPLMFLALISVLMVISMNMPNTLTMKTNISKMSNKQKSMKW